MDAFITLIVFAVFFYVMMRFGCGAHVIHGGQRDHNKKDVKPTIDQSIDRVDDRAANGNVTPNSNKARDVVNLVSTQDDGNHSGS